MAENAENTRTPVLLALAAYTAAAALVSLSISAAYGSPETSEIVAGAVSGLVFGALSSWALAILDPRLGRTIHLSALPTALLFGTFVAYRELLLEAEWFILAQFILRLICAVGAVAFGLYKLLRRKSVPAKTETLARPAAGRAGETKKGSAALAAARGYAAEAWTNIAKAFRKMFDVQM